MVSCGGGSGSPLPLSASSQRVRRDNQQHLRRGEKTGACTVCARAREAIQERALCVTALLYLEPRRKAGHVRFPPPPLLGPDCWAGLFRVAHADFALLPPWLLCGFFSLSLPPPPRCLWLRKEILAETNFFVCFECIGVCSVVSCTSASMSCASPKRWEEVTTCCSERHCIFFFFFLWHEMYQTWQGGWGAVMDASSIVLSCVHLFWTALTKIV